MMHIVNSEKFKNLQREAAERITTEVPPTVTQDKKVETRKVINLIANEKFKALGCKWNGWAWEAPRLAQKEFEEIKKEFYEDLIDIEITVVPEENLEGREWGLPSVK